LQSRQCWRVAEDFSWQLHFAGRVRAMLCQAAEVSPVLKDLSLVAEAADVKVIHHLDNLPDQFRCGAVTVGNFDGVHLGHARIIGKLVEQASRQGGPAVVFTFDPHPARILRPHQAPAPLTWPQRKAELLGQLGVDAVIAYPTDEAFLELKAQEFFDRMVLGRLQARSLVEGANFFFGRDRLGNVDMLQGLCHKAGIGLSVVEPLETGGRMVSSSRVRELVAAGRLDRARQMLTEPYRIRGTVVRGVGRGDKLGFPTANLAEIDTLLPGEGIYVGRAMVDGRLWPAAISIGPNPTFGEQTTKVESHLAGYNDTLYGTTIELDFLARLRDIMQFGSATELISQLDRDVAATREIVARYETQGAKRA